MKILNHQVTHQHEYNKTLLNEVERIRVEICKPHEEAPSILQPRILDFDSLGSLWNRQDTTASPPTTTSTWGVIPDK